MASPLTIINRQNEQADIQAISDIIRHNQVERIIVGLPRSMDGAIGRQAEKVTAFAEELRKHIQVPLEFRDERLSTVSARRLIREIKKTGKVRDDAIAAALILQGYLEESRS